MVLGFHPFRARPPRFACFTRRLGSTALGNRFKILFLGRDEFSCLVFKHLYSAEDVWGSISVATKPGPSPLHALAQSMNVPFDFIPAKKSDFKYWIPPSPFSAPDPHHVLITASFGRILTPAQLDLFAPARRLNLHGSILPAYRGPAPIHHAIINSEAETGVSVVQMRKYGIDKGPVWGTAKIPISPDATFSSLRVELADLGARLLVDVLRQMIAGTAVSTPQPPESPTPHAHSITTADAILDFTTMSATDILARHRAIGHQRALTTWMPSGVRLQLHAPTSAPGPYSLSLVPGATTYDKHSGMLLIRCSGESCHCGAACAEGKGDTHAGGARVLERRHLAPKTAGGPRAATRTFGEDPGSVTVAVPSQMQCVLRALATCSRREWRQGPKASMTFKSSSRYMSLRYSNGYVRCRPDRHV
ncbi:formyl transferase [Mycena rebaudengoi]|nr:formyl transferase [Mycena rebaudengoi]